MFNYIITGLAIAYCLWIGVKIEQLTDRVDVIGVNVTASCETLTGDSY